MVIYLSNPLLLVCSGMSEQSEGMERNREALWVVEGRIGLGSEYHPSPTGPREPVSTTHRAQVLFAHTIRSIPSPIPYTTPSITSIFWILLPCVCGVIEGVVYR